MSFDHQALTGAVWDSVTTQSLQEEVSIHRDKVCFSGGKGVGDGEWRGVRILCLLVHLFHSFYGRKVGFFLSQIL